MNLRNRLLLNESAFVKTLNCLRICLAENHPSCLQVMVGNLRTLSSAMSHFLRRFYLVAASTPLHVSHPENFRGVFTKFGWVVVPKRLIAPGWTQPQLNKYIEENKTTESLLIAEAQALTDVWALKTYLSQKPVVKRKTKQDIEQDERLRLYLQQLREEDVVIKQGRKVREPRIRMPVSPTNVTFTHAWNYFVSQRYSKFNHLSKSEARAKVGSEWRAMSADEKEMYREQYVKLLLEGKDVLQGKIVDREVKAKAVERLNQAKARKLQKKLEKLEEAKLEETKQEGKVDVATLDE